MTCLSLSQADVLLFISLLEYQRWPTRWVGAPGQDEILAYVDGLEARLQEVLDCGDSMDCDDVVQCIVDNQNNPALIDAIGNAWSFSGQAQAVARAIEEAKAAAAQSVAAKTGLSCPNVIYNMSREMFARLANDVIDFLQQVEVQSNAFEFTAAILSLATDGTVGGILEFVANAQDNILEVFEAEITDEYLDDLACQMYQANKTKCALSVDDFLIYLSVRLQTPTFTDVVQAIGALGGFILATNPLMSLALMATALVAAKFGALKLSTPLGDYQINAGAMARYRSLLTVAAQTEAVIPVDCEIVVNEAIYEFAGNDPYSYSIIPNTASGIPRGLAKSIDVQGVMTTGIEGVVTPGNANVYDIYIQLVAPLNRSITQVAVRTSLGSAANFLVKGADDVLLFGVVGISSGVRTTTFAVNFPPQAGLRIYIGASNYKPFLDRVVLTLAPQ